MRINLFRHLLVVASFLMLSPAAREANAQPNFDQGAEIQSLVETMAKKARLIRLERTTILQANSLSPSKGPTLGIDLIARVEQSATYAEALPYPPLIENLPEDPRRKLEVDWADIMKERASLLTEAAALEKLDQELTRRGDELNRNAERLNKQKAALVSEVDRFNRTCTGRPLPPDEHSACVRWQNDLLKRIDLHNAEVEAHNARFIQWRKDVENLHSRAGTASRKGAAVAFLPRVAAWESQKIRPFIRSAESALSGLGPTRVVIQAQGKQPPVQKSVSIITQDPLCKEAGHQLLAQLWEKLSASERAERDEALLGAKTWIDSRPPRGVTAPPPVRKTFQNRNLRDPHARIDIDVWSGTAFVTCTCCSKSQP